MHDASIADKMGRDSGQGGFTFVEVLMASLVTVALFIAVFEAMIFCKKSALAASCLSGAECLAYDELMSYLNLDLKWFKEKVPEEGGYSSTEPLWHDEESQLYEDDDEYREARLLGYFPKGLSADDVVIETTVAVIGQAGAAPGPTNAPLKGGWTISVDVKWKTPGVPGLASAAGGERWSRLPEPLVVQRAPLERHKPKGGMGG